MNNPTAKRVTIKGRAIAHDKYGNPKIDDSLLKKFWPYLTNEDKEKLKDRYDKMCNNST